MPVRAQGSRWICYKRAALQRFVDRYGAYINHLTALAEDVTVRSDDRARIKGWLKKWMDSRMLIGAALYIDVLKPASVLSLTLQGEKLDIVQGLRSILKSAKSLRSMSDEDFRQLPTVSLVRSRVKEEDGSTIYQGAALHSYSSSSIKVCADQVHEDSRKLESKMKERLEWSDSTMLRAILVFLDTQSWACAAGSSEDDLTEMESAVELLISKFREPLEAKGAVLAAWYSG